jgi:hypothetical protein
LIKFKKGVFMGHKYSACLLGLSLLCAGMKAHSSDSYEIIVQDGLGIARRVSCPNAARFNQEIYEIISQSLEKPSGTFDIVILGKVLDPKDEINKRAITGGSSFRIRPKIIKTKSIQEIPDGQGLYKDVTDRLKRKYDLFQRERGNFKSAYDQKLYLAALECLLTYSGPLDDMSAMCKLTPDHRASVFSLLSQEFKIGPDILKKDEELRCAISRYEPDGRQKYAQIENKIMNAIANLSALSDPLEQKAYIDDIKKFYEDSILRSYVFMSVVSYYAVKHPDDFSETSLTQQCLEKLRFGEQNPLNDWLPCPLAVARLAIEEHDEAANQGKTPGKTFAEYVIDVRKWLQDLKNEREKEKS